MNINGQTQVCKHKPTFARVVLHLSNQRYTISQKIKLNIKTIYHHSSYQNCRSGPRRLQFSTLLYLKEKISISFANFEKKNLIYFKSPARTRVSSRSAARFRFSAASPVLSAMFGRCLGRRPVMGVDTKHMPGCAVRISSCRIPCNEGLIYA